MKRFCLTIFLLTGICVFGDTYYTTNGITATAKGNVIIRAPMIEGVYVFTNTSDSVLSLEYVNVYSDGEVDGVATSTYSRLLPAYLTRASVVETNYAGTVETNWAFSVTNTSVSWTGTYTNAVSGTNFGIDLNDKCVLLLDEVYTLTMPVTTNTYYLDIHAKKE